MPTNQGTIGVPPMARQDGRGLRRIHLLTECLRSALDSIVAHSMRSILTMLGIVIGVAAIIAVVSLVQGLSASIATHFQGLGGNVLTVRADTPFEDALLGKVNRLKSSDVEQISRRIDGIKDITPVVVISTAQLGEVHNGIVKANAIVIGTNRHYQDVQGRFAASGRFITENDDTTGRRIAVIGEKLRQKLKLPTNPIGHYVQIGAEWFKIVGCMEKRGDMFGISQDDYLLIPYQTALRLTGRPYESDMSISLTVVDPESVHSVRGAIRHLLRRQHQLKDDQPDDFIVETPESLLKSFREISTLVTTVTSGVVAISLLVAGVGIMNIMLVSVTERTQEIGVAKALGAPREFILIQFLTEAVLLALIGGLAGIVLGIALTFIACALIPSLPVPSIPWGAAAASTVFSMIVGVVFGLLPASKAANLKPIDALRFE